MLRHADGSVTLSEEEYAATALIAKFFNTLIPYLENIVHLMDDFEDKLVEVDSPSLFHKERVN